MTPIFFNNNKYLIIKAFYNWLELGAKNSQYGSAIFGGGFVRELEKQFKNIFNVKYAIAVSSGTAGLHSGLFALNVNKKVNVFIINNNWVGIESLIRACGTEPLSFSSKEFLSFVSVKENSEKFRKKKKVAIFVLNKSEENMILKLIAEKCYKLNINLIEDWSAIKKINLLKTSAPVCGSVAIFSFGYDKWLQCGEGGMVLSNQKIIIKKVINFSQHSISIKAHGLYENAPSVCLNYRMHPFTASLAVAQLKELIN